MVPEMTKIRLVTLCATLGTLAAVFGKLPWGP